MNVKHLGLIALTAVVANTVESVSLITSDRNADPATPAAWVRGYRETENRLHWVSDVTCQEGRSLVRTGNAARGPQRTRKLLQSALTT